MSRLSKKTPAKRTQYAALPYRRKRNSRTEVLLVTSRDTGRWIIPKGWPAKGKSPHKSAAREAREEAGVVGTIKRRPLGAANHRPTPEPCHRRQLAAAGRSYAAQWDSRRLAQQLAEFYAGVLAARPLSTSTRFVGADPGARSANVTHL